MCDSQSAQNNWRGIKWYKSVIGVFVDNIGTLRNFLRGRRSDSSMSKDQRYLLKSRIYKKFLQIFERSISTEVNFSIYLSCSWWTKLWLSPILWKWREVHLIPHAQASRHETYGDENARWRNDKVQVSHDRWGD